jgi:hypothetical protein
MNAPAEPVSENPTDFRSEWYEPFPEPRTIPAGWDLTGLVGAVSLAPEESDPETEILSA